MGFASKIGVLLTLAAAAIVAALLSPRVPQDHTYHLFADQRTTWGVPNFWNVVSNLPFVAVGLYGLWAWKRARWIEPGDRYPWLVVAIGAVFIGFGSGYYHWRAG